MLGWDLGAGLALGAALGICPRATAELLPAIEAAAVGAMNDRLEGEHDDP